MPPLVPLSRRRTPRLIAVLAGLLLTAGVIEWAVRGSGRSPDSLARPRSIAKPVPPPSAPRAPGALAVASPRESLVANAHLTRAEAAEELRQIYRQEELTRELEFEQRRYGANYWSAEADGAQLAALRRERDAMIARLNSEANAVLALMFPPETGEPIALAAIFGDDHPGPNLSGVSPAGRQKLEVEILAAAEVDPANLLAVASQILPAADLASYRQWNAPAVIALRHELVGFAPSEREFLAILRAAPGEEDGRDAAVTNVELAAELGGEREAEFRRTIDPAYQTAVQALQRLGRPLADASWLAATRARATSEIQQVRQDPALGDAAKTERVAAVERAYGQAITARLALPVGSLDDFGPAP